ncbi:MAG: Iron-dependent repressor IdeR [Opitutia bacterium UBA7350]|nr:MAG: Iron-dependent repressor IdeR [Opitutae bacterium UBA7350]
MASMKAFKSTGNRSHLEDALKHLWVFEQEKLDTTTQSVAGALECRRIHARKILAKLQEVGLAESRGETYRLTESGKEYALQILRAHRLYETFLANETGIVGKDWHAEAERVEHELSSEDTNRLAQALGHPRFDPHGDPIPTRAGQSTIRQGCSLRNLKIGQLGRIVRLKDNPDTVFDRICKAGLAPNLCFEIEQLSDDSIQLRIAGREIYCDREMVDSLIVEPLPENINFTHEALRLSDLKLNQKAEILSISPACRGTERRRLLDLGFVKGGIIELELNGIFKSPIAYRVRNTVVALRKNQSENIFVQILGSNDPS